MLPLAVAAHAMASLQGPTSLGGICSGVCGRKKEVREQEKGKEEGAKSGVDAVSAHAAFTTVVHLIAADVVRSRPVNPTFATRIRRFCALSRMHTDGSASPRPPRRRVALEPLYLFIYADVRLNML